jgi:putative transposase
LRDRQARRSVRHHRPKAYQATGPNQVWSWDITFLPTTVKGLYFYLYLVMDIYSRKIVGWAVYDIQLSEYGAALIKQACLDEGVKSAQLVLHSDNGTPMKGISMLGMLENLGIIPSFSRPSVSDDNPYSEALFRTVKYRPEFPLSTKFETPEEARNWSEKLVVWYNQVHLHSALKFIPPQQRHCGEDANILAKRHEVYEMAKSENPIRWSGKTRNWTLPDVVWLNPNKKHKSSGSCRNRSARDGTNDGSRQAANAVRQQG